MSAADHVVIRTRDGDVRVMPRRAALGLIARGSAKVEPRGKSARPVKGKAAAVPPVQKPIEVRVPRVRAKGSTARVLPVVDPDAPVVETGDDFKAGRVVADRPNHPTSKARKAEAAAVPVVQSAPVAAVLPVEPVRDAVVPAADDVTALPIDAPADEVKLPRLSASRKIWAEYAASVHGVEITSDMTRNQIRDTVTELMETARMSRPAFAEFSVEGGRPATPEDVPVTKVVTHADPDDATA